MADRLEARLQTSSEEERDEASKGQGDGRRGIPYGHA